MGQTPGLVRWSWQVTLRLHGQKLWGMWGSEHGLLWPSMKPCACPSLSLLFQAQQNLHQRHTGHFGSHTRCIPAAPTCKLSSRCLRASAESGIGPSTAEEAGGAMAPARKEGHMSFPSGRCAEAQYDLTCPCTLLLVLPQEVQATQTPTFTW